MSSSLQVTSREELLSLAVEHIPFGMCMFDAADRLVLSNARFQQLYGHSDSMVRPGTPFATIIAHTRGVEVKARDASATGAERPLHNRADDDVIVREWRLENGCQIEITIARIGDGSCVALHEDVTEQRQALEKIVYLSRHDPLTGLLNRDRLFYELERELMSEDGGFVSVFVIDLDKFKAVNDCMGHAAGDELIVQVATRLSAAVERHGHAGRLGGDEFALVLPTLQRPNLATEFADCIVNLLRMPYYVEGRPLSIGASVGSATVSRNQGSADEILRMADRAMYRAKNSRRSLARPNDINPL